MKRVMVAALAALVLSSCGGISEGTVTAKQYVPEKNWTTQEADYDTRCTGTGDKKKCKRVFDEMETVEHHEDACYQLHLEQRSGKGGKVETGSLCVPEADYNAHEVGDYYKESE